LQRKGEILKKMMFREKMMWKLENWKL